MIALLEAKRAGLFKAGHWLNNLVAGVVVGVVALPLSMAFAIASGARPEQGIYTAIVAGLIVSLFGGSRLQIAGPTGAFIAVLAGITASYGIAGLQVATFMAGVMLLLMGLLRLGGVVRFIPAPVIIGFTAGIGVIIFTGQWSYFLGVKASVGGPFHEKLWAVLEQLPQTHWPTVVIGALSLLVLLAAPRVSALKRLPATLFVLVLATGSQALFSFDGVATIGSAFGGIPQGLPALVMPDVSMSQMLLLIGPAFAIAMLGAIESLLSAVVADRMSGTKHSANQELVGQGLANIVAPFFGGFAATGAIARTATNIRNGGSSPLSGVIHVFTLVAVLVLAAPLATDIPLASLSAILFVVAWNMSEPRQMRKILTQAPTADRVILVVVFLLTVFVDLVVAVNAGIVLAILHFLRRMSQAVRLHTVSDSGEYRISRVEGPLFFAAVGLIETAAQSLPGRVRHWALDFSQTPFIDETAIQALEEAITHLKRREVGVILVGANDLILKKLRAHGTLSLLSEGSVVNELPSSWGEFD